MKSIRFDVFGRDVLVVATDDGWKVYHLGAEGKRRPAHNITVPADITESELTQYLDDLLHEWATESNNTVRRVN